MITVAADDKLARPPRIRDDLDREHVFRFDSISELGAQLEQSVSGQFLTAERDLIDANLCLDRACSPGSERPLFLIQAEGSS